MVVISDYWANNNHEWDILNSIDCWLYPFIIPTIYVFVCLKIGISRVLLNAACMLAFALMNFTSGIALNPIDSQANVPVEYFHFSIYWGDKILFSSPIHEIVLTFQGLWLAARLFNYRYVMKLENTHLSPEATHLMKVIINVIVIGLTGAILPESLFTNSYGVYIFAEIPASIALTYTIYLIGKGYMLTPVIDSNNEQAISTITESKESVFEKVDSYLQKSKCFLNKDLQIIDVAKAVGSNRNYISAAIQAATGNNFSTYINQYRVNTAKKMIIDDPKAKLDDIAMTCGFGSASSFTKIYKKHTGTTPSELRTKIRKAPNSK